MVNQILKLSFPLLLLIVVSCTDSPENQTAEEKEPDFPIGKQVSSENFPAWYGWISLWWMTEPSTPISATLPLNRKQDRTGTTTQVDRFFFQRMERATTRKEVNRSGFWKRRYNNMPTGCGTLAWCITRQQVYTYRNRPESRQRRCGLVRSSYGWRV